MTDNDGRSILLGQVDEEFRFVQQQLKQTVAELLRVYLKGKYPLKTDGDIGLLPEERMRGDVQEEEWTDIIKYVTVPVMLYHQWSGWWLVCSGASVTRWLHPLTKKKTTYTNYGGLSQ